MSENSSIYKLSANVGSFLSRVGLPSGNEPVHKLSADETLFEGGEVVLAVLYQIAAIGFHPGHIHKRHRYILCMQVVYQSPNPQTMLVHNWINFLKV